MEALLTRAENITVFTCCMMEQREDLRNIYRADILPAHHLR